MSWLLVLNDWSHVRRAVDSYFEEDEQHMSLYLLLWYGTSIIIQTYQEGERTQKIDLMPDIYVKFHGFEKFRAVDWPQLTHLWKDDTRELVAKPDAEVFFDSKDNVLGLDWDVTIDWESIPIEPLSGKLLQKNERATFYQNYGEIEDCIQYGIHETEAGLYKRNFRWQAWWDMSVPDETDSGITHE